MPQRKPFLLRIDPALWSELESWAQDELRSVNGQIEYLLRSAVRRRQRAVEEPRLTSGEVNPPSSNDTAG